MDKYSKNKCSRCEVNYVLVGHQLCALCEAQVGQIHEDEPIDLEKTKELIERRGIKKLVHFTQLKYLDSIKRYGILPFAVLANRNILYERNDELRKDGNFDAISLSITNPNHYLLRSYTNKLLDNYPNKRTIDWVEISIDPALLYENTAKRIYYETNASTADGGRGTSVKHFENMFQDTVKYDLSSGNSRTIYRESYRKDNEPTDVQAEIQYFDRIDPKYFLNIEIINDEEF